MSICGRRERGPWTPAHVWTAVDLVSPLQLLQPIAVPWRGWVVGGCTYVYCCVCVEVRGQLWVPPSIDLYFIFCAIGLCH